MVRHAKFLAPCLNHFGTALPIYTPQNKSFFSSWVRFQFLIGTPSLHLFYSWEMADKQLAVILHHILRVKCDLHRNRKSRHRLIDILAKWRKTTEGEMSHNVLSIISKNFHFFSFACSTPAGLVFLLFIFLFQLFHFIYQILHRVTFKIYIFHLDLRCIQKASKGNLLLNNILQSTKEKIPKNISMDNALECSSDSNVL